MSLETLLEAAEFLERNHSLKNTGELPHLVNLIKNLQTNKKRERDINHVFNPTKMLHNQLMLIRLAVIWKSIRIYQSHFNFIPIRQVCLVQRTMNCIWSIVTANWIALVRIVVGQRALRLAFRTQPTSRVGRQFDVIAIWLVPIRRASVRRRADIESCIRHWRRTGERIWDHVLTNWWTNYPKPNIRKRNIPI